jgi:hypothetical protein
MFNKRTSSSIKCLRAKLYSMVQEMSTKPFGISSVKSFPKKESTMFFDRRKRSSVPRDAEVNEMGHMTHTHAHEERMENYKILQMRSKTEAARKLGRDCGTAIGILFLSLLCPSILSRVTSETETESSTTAV